MWRAGETPHCVFEALEGGSPLAHSRSGKGAPLSQIQQGADDRERLPAQLLLADAAACACLPRTFGVAATVVDRHHEHKRRRAAGANRSHEIEAEAPLERKVDDDEIGAGGLERIERFAPSCGLSADGEIGFVVDQGGEPSPQQGIGVDDDDAPLGPPAPFRALGD